MKKKPTSTKAVTFTFPVDVHQELRVLVGSQKMSQFVVEAVREKLAKERSKLGDAYKQAEKQHQDEGHLAYWDSIQGGH